ncbi:Ankyrin repeat domain-containing protein [Plasmodiophora brassicae]
MPATLAVLIAGLLVGVLDTAVMANVWDVPDIRVQVPMDSFELLLDIVPGLVRLRHVADTRERLAIVEELRRRLVAGGDDVTFLNTAAWDGDMTLLQWASYKGDVMIVPFLLSAPGIDANVAEGVHQKTPLHLAVIFEQFHVIRLLLRVGNIDVNAMDWDRKTPLQYALERWQGSSPSRSLRRTIQKLIRVGAGVGTTEMSPLYWAVDRGLEDVVKLLLSMHVDVNFGGPSKKTPLYNAVKKDHPDIVEMLLKVPGIDLVTGNPLLVAVRNDLPDIVAMLLRCNGIDVNAGNPLLEAVQNDRLSIVQMLINDIRVDVNAGDPSLKAPGLHNVEIAELPIKAQGLDDTTPGFHKAMRHAKVVDQWAANRVLQTPTRSRGSTPDVSRTSSKKRVSRLLCCGDDCV